MPVAFLLHTGWSSWPAGYRESSIAKQRIQHNCTEVQAGMDGIRQPIYGMGVAVARRPGLTREAFRAPAISTGLTEQRREDSAAC